MRLGEAYTPYLSGIANPTTAARAPQHARTAAGGGAPGRIAMAAQPVTRLGEVYDPYVTGIIDRAALTRRAPHAPETTRTAAARPVTRLGADYDPYVAGTAGPAGKDIKLWDHNGFSFGDLVDIVNPLQHIPVISSLYRAMTKDDIGALPRLLGGALYGGVIGAVASLANIVVDQATGRDIGGNVIAMITGGGTAGDGGAAATAQLADKTAAGAAGRMLDRTSIPGTGARRPAMTVKPWINPDMVAAAGISATQSARAAAVPDARSASPGAASPGAVSPKAATARTIRPGALAGAIAGGDRAGRPGTVAGLRRTPPAAKTAARAKTSANDKTAANDKTTGPEAAARGRSRGKPTRAARAGASGHAPTRAAAGPWIPEAMRGALDKYQRMLQQRRVTPGKVDLRT